MFSLKLTLTRSKHVGVKSVVHLLVLKLLGVKRAGA
jgi:hypothetical protein